MIIGAIIPDRRDSTSVYRGVGPLAALRRDYGHQTVHLRSIDWSTLREIDVLFMQRPCLPEHLQAIRAAKANNVPVWVDFDDDLASVPDWNPTTMLYNVKKYGPNTLDAAAMADLLTVSTRRLLEVYKTDGNAVVVPNAIDIEWLPYNPKPRDPSKKIVLWRGSGTHRWDLNLLWPAVRQIEVNRDEVRFVFMSDNPPWFVEYMKTEAEFVPWMDYPSYMRALNDIAPDVVVVPLYDCPLNRAKSNIAALEACWAGALVVAPDWEEWQGNGFIFRYAEKERMARDIERALTFTHTNSFFVAHPEAALTTQTANRHNLLIKLMESR